MAYLARPSPAAWYEAHNRTLEMAVHVHGWYAALESRDEQAVIGETCLRTVVAEALVIGGALGPWVSVSRTRAMESRHRTRRLLAQLELRCLRLKGMLDEV